MEELDPESVPAPGASPPTKMRLVDDLRRWLRNCPAPRVRAFGKGTVFLRPRGVVGGEFIEIGERAYLGPGTSLHVMRAENINDAPRLEIGDDVYITSNAWITCANRITIASGCVLSKNVYVTDVEHGYDPSAGPILHQPVTSKGPVEIRANTFIGYGACILPGVTLGRNCVVGTKSVVTRSFPDYSMVVGSPARLIKTYSFEKRQWVPVK